MIFLECRMLFNKHGRPKMNRFESQVGIGDMQAVPMTMIEYLILYVSKGRLNLILYPISPMFLKMLRKRVSQFLSFKFEKETFVLSSRKRLLNMTSQHWNFVTCVILFHAGISFHKFIFLPISCGVHTLLFMKLKVISFLMPSRVFIFILNTLRFASQKSLAC